jgi:hypothetical protein
MSGFVGHAYQWSRFETKLRRIQERDGFKIFHAKDFKGKSGEFAGWDDTKGQRLISDLTELVRDNLTEGLTVALEHSRYQKEYRAPPIPKKMSLDSQYGVCFRACLAQILDLMARRGNRDKMHIVFEGGHKNVGDCRRIFDDIKSRYSRSGSDILGTFSVEKKETCPPLMVSDFLAAAHSMMRAIIGQGGQSYQDVAAHFPIKSKAALTFIELRPDALTGLKTGFERMRQLEIEEWRAKKKGQ